ncbi:hypothetical protein V5799_032806 [Amblyomma americanum]|uniref:C2H2-type domain-containing protein n=1 Tax=Amblyomma americanum TaxID=6943 RepID=A0AAQ4DQ48_AMBAM
MASNISIQAVPPTNRNISCYGQGKSVPHVERCSTSQNSESVLKRVSSEELSALGLSFEVHTEHSEDVSSSHSDDKAPVLSAPFEFDKIRAREVPCMDEPRLTNKSKAPLDNDVNVIDAWIMREPQEESVTCADDTSNGTSRTQLSEEQAVSPDLAAPCAVNLEPSPDTYEPKGVKSGEYVTCEPSQDENTAKTPTPEVCENVPDNPGTLSDGSLAGAPSDKNETWSCPICSKVLSSKSSLERHRLFAHLDSNAKQCSLCFEVLPDDSSLDRHRLQVHPQASTVLRKAKTVKPGAKAKTVKPESKGKTVKPESKAKTIQPEAKTVQPKAKTVYRAAKVFVCSICSVELSSKSNLERHHYSAHTGVSPWKCTACSTTLPSWSSLARHRRIAHGETWECPICSKVLSCKSSLDRHHQLVHTERQPLKCPHCHKTFGWKQTLDEHIRSHTGERPFACHLCPYKFAHRAALWRHLRSHTNDRRFSCHLCPNSFLSRDNLTRHLRSHAKVKMYECSVCSARLSTSYGLGRHLVNMHNNHQLYACAVCDERFWKASELNAHVSKCHPSAGLSADAAPV